MSMSAGSLVRLSGVNSLGVDPISLRVEEVLTEEGFGDTGGRLKLSTCISTLPSPSNGFPLVFKLAPTFGASF